MRLNHFTSDTPAGGATTYPVDETKLTQDFYDAVNGQWAEHAEIPGTIPLPGASWIWSIISNTR
ncbi:hypothetical protein L3X07_01185 [Levilactobacillus brevis]|nr:hypothetical protein [Levilactobacillus brevis]